MTDAANNFKAAAKLVLQDLDPEVKAKRQEFMAGVPKCCLVLHLRKLKKFNRQVFKQSQFVAAQELAFSIKVTCQEQSKSTKPRIIQRENKKSQEKSKIKVKTYDSIMDGDAELVIDATKAFSLVLSRKSDTEDHEIQFDLIYIEKNDEESNERSKERKSVFAVGSASISLNELQEEASKEKNIVFKIKEQTVFEPSCELEVEFVCKYGQFGYGFSHQLGSNDRTPFQNIEDSIFFRVNGENERKGHDDILLPAHIGHPAVLKVKDPVNIGNPAVRQALWNLSEDSPCFLVDSERSCRLVEDLMKTRGRLEQKRQEFARKMSRSERMKFLRDNLSSNKESKGDGSGPSSGASQTGGLNVPGTTVRRTSKQNLEDFFNKIANKNLPK
ncbi:Oidioi.mRNA.OKI2018_I69.chr2.g5774.t1.cds [Oikopleura dioica]|uniref:Oidioi.mRNA.OKI2018_I69.chr2.g5774.t1.cds n=1 Tax=Oikopleura dioica TaxID=34765 RepID=A0ABN7T7W6_OIKDI|nr:Oidioi.mRNA.OKI2018_I69.chr2.g5774.t1.cds [Oikopleura dioica]